MYRGRGAIFLTVVRCLQINQTDTLIAKCNAPRTGSNSEPGGLQDGFAEMGGISPLTNIYLVVSQRVILAGGANPILALWHKDLHRIVTKL
jgi:hypothetical protein